MSYPSSHSQRAYRKTQYQQLWWLSSKKQSNCSKAYYYIGKWEWEGDCDQTMHLLRGNLIVILPVCLLSFPLLPFSVTLLQKKKRKKKSALNTVAAQHLTELWRWRLDRGGFSNCLTHRQERLYCLFMSGDRVAEGERKQKTSCLSSMLLCARDDYASSVCLSF